MKGKSAKFDSIKGSFVGGGLSCKPAAGMRQSRSSHIGGSMALKNMPVRDANQATPFHDGRQPIIFRRPGQSGFHPLTRRPFELLIGVASSLTHEAASLTTAHESNDDGAKTKGSHEQDQNTPDNPKNVGGSYCSAASPGCRLGKMWSSDAY